MSDSELADGFIGGSIATGGGVGLKGWPVASPERMKELCAAHGPHVIAGDGWDVLYGTDNGKHVLTYTPINGPQIKIECTGWMTLSFPKQPEGE